MSPIEESRLTELLKTLNEGESSQPLVVDNSGTRKSPSKSGVKRSKKWASAPSWFAPSKFGEQVANELELFVKSSTPTMLVGGTGLGKTVLTDMVARSVGRGSVGCNCYAGMDIASLVGLWRPKGDGTIVWEHGVLTRAIIDGWIVRIEEYTRATPELKSKMFGILDTKGRYWALPEGGIDQVPVHEDFCLIASANPAGNGYIGTMREDKASMSRFGGVIEINEPLADEKQAMLNSTNDEDLSERIVRFAQLLRRDPLTYISTRDMYYLGQTIKAGMDAKRAVEVTITPKFEGSETAIITHARSVFEELGKDININSSVADAIKKERSE